MWMYPGLSYPDCPSSEELSEMEVEAQIHKVLDLGVNLNSGANPVPLRRGITGSCFIGFHDSIFSLRLRSCVGSWGWPR
jgi:hypothetical protein